MSWDSSNQQCDPESQDPVDPYKIECPPSQLDGSEPLFDDSISSSQEGKAAQRGTVNSYPLTGSTSFSLLDLTYH